MAASFETRSGFTLAESVRSCARLIPCFEAGVTGNIK